MFNRVTEFKPSADIK